MLITNQEYDLVKIKRTGIYYIQKKIRTQKRSKNECLNRTNSKVSRRGQISESF